MSARRSPPWTHAELAILDDVYPREGLNGVADLLSDRSWHAIHVMAHKRGLRCTLVTEAPKPKLQGERLEQAIEMREERGWSFARIGAELGVSEAGACNAVLVALCTRKGYRPAERDAKGRLLPEGIERLRYALRKGYKGVDIQLRLGLSAGRVAEERRRYSRELKSKGLQPLPAPGGGRAYSGVKVPRTKISEIEAALMAGLGTLKVSERTGASKTTITRVRNRLIRRLRRSGQVLPGCDASGRRVRVTDHFHAIPDSARMEFRHLLIDKRMSARRAGLWSGIGGSNAHWMREAIIAELAASGQELPPRERVDTKEAKRAAAAADVIFPRGRTAMASFRHLAARIGYPAARQQLREDFDARQAAAKAAARAEALRPLSFDEKLAKVARGEAGIVPKIPLRRPDYAGTLGGVASGAL